MRARRLGSRHSILLAVITATACSGPRLRSLLSLR
jgi:hypothetical protein